MTRSTLGNYSLLALLALSSALGCSNKAGDCRYMATCPGAEMGGADAGSDGGVEAGNATGGASSACSPACSGTNPVCNEATKTCVQCTKESQCSTPRSLCDMGTNTCVQCKANTDCGLASASICVEGTCEGCVANADCSHIANNGVCKTTASSAGDAGTGGLCVQCTTTNETPCGGNSCNPITNVCTSTRRDTVDVCHLCVADSECIDDSAASSHPSARCISMNFKGTARGGYCLPRVAGGCSNPYQVPLFSTVSLSSAASEDYCGINQNATTCEAVLDLSKSKACSLDTDCGTGQNDGLCKTVGLNPLRCTIPCGSDSNCLSQAPGNTCSSTVNGYCH